MCRQTQVICSSGRCVAVKMVGEQLGRAGLNRPMTSSSERESSERKRSSSEEEESSMRAGGTEPELERTTKP